MVFYSAISILHIVAAFCVVKGQTLSDEPKVEDITDQSVAPLTNASFTWDGTKESERSFKDFGSRHARGENSPQNGENGDILTESSPEFEFPDVIRASQPDVRAKQPNILTNDDVLNIAHRVLSMRDDLKIVKDVISVIANPNKEKLMFSVPLNPNLNRGYSAPKNVDTIHGVKSMPDNLAIGNGGTSGQDKSEDIRDSILSLSESYYQSTDWTPKNDGLDVGTSGSLDVGTSGSLDVGTSGSLDSAYARIPLADEEIFTGRPSARVTTLPVDNTEQIKREDHERRTNVLQSDDPNDLWSVDQSMTSSGNISLRNKDPGPGSTETQPGSTETEPGSTENQPGSTETQPGSTGTQPGSTETEPGSTETQSYTTMAPHPSAELNPQNPDTVSLNGSWRQDNLHIVRDVELTPDVQDHGNSGTKVGILYETHSKDQLQHDETHSKDQLQHDETHSNDQLQHLFNLERQLQLYKIEAEENATLQRQHSTGTIGKTSDLVTPDHVKHVELSDIFQLDPRMRDTPDMNWPPQNKRMHEDLLNDDLTNRETDTSLRDRDGQLFTADNLQILSQDSATKGRDFGHNDISRHLGEVDATGAQASMTPQLVQSDLLMLGLGPGNIQDNVMGNQQDNEMGNQQDNVMGNQQDNERGNQQDNVMGNQQDNVMGNQQDNERGNQQDNVMGNQQDNEMGNQQDNVMGNQQDNEMGNQQDNEMGNQQDNERVNQQENEMGNQQDNERVNQQENEMGNPQDNKMEKQKDNEVGNQNENEKGNQQDNIRMAPLSSAQQLTNILSPFELEILLEKVVFPYLNQHRTKTGDDSQQSNFLSPGEGRWTTGLGGISRSNRHGQGIQRNLLLPVDQHPDIKQQLDLMDIFNPVHNSDKLTDQKLSLLNTFKPVRQSSERALHKPVRQSSERALHKPVRQSSERALHKQARPLVLVNGLDHLTQFNELNPMTRFNEPNPMTQFNEPNLMIHLDKPNKMRRFNERIPKISQLPVLYQLLNQNSGGHQGPFNQHPDGHQGPFNQYPDGHQGPLNQHPDGHQGPLNQYPDGHQEPFNEYSGGLRRSSSGQDIMTATPTSPHKRPPVYGYAPDIQRNLNSPWSTPLKIWEIPADLFGTQGWAGQSRDAPEYRGNSQPSLGELLGDLLKSYNPHSNPRESYISSPPLHQSVLTRKPDDFILPRFNKHDHISNANLDQSNLPIYKPALSFFTRVNNGDKGAKHQPEIPAERFETHQKFSPWEPPVGVPQHHSSLMAPQSYKVRLSESKPLIPGKKDKFSRPFFSPRRQAQIRSRDTNALHEPKKTSQKSVLEQINPGPYVDYNTPVTSSSSKQPAGDQPVTSKPSKQKAIDHPKPIPLSRYYRSRDSAHNNINSLNQRFRNKKLFLTQQFQMFNDEIKMAGLKEKKKSRVQVLPWGISVQPQQNDIYELSEGHSVELPSYLSRSPSPQFEQSFEPGDPGVLFGLDKIKIGLPVDEDTEMKQLADVDPRQSGSAGSGSGLGAGRELNEGMAGVYTEGADIERKAGAVTDPLAQAAIGLPLNSTTIFTQVVELPQNVTQQVVEQPDNFTQVVELPDNVTHVVEQPENVTKVVELPDNVTLVELPESVNQVVKQHGHVSEVVELPVNITNETLSHVKAAIFKGDNSSLFISETGATAPYPSLTKDTADVNINTADVNNDTVGVNIDTSGLNIDTFDKNIDTSVSLSQDPALSSLDAGQRTNTSSRNMGVAQISDVTSGANLGNNRAVWFGSTPSNEGNILVSEPMHKDSENSNLRLKRDIHAIEWDKSRPVWSLPRAWGRGRGEVHRTRAKRANHVIGDTASSSDTALTSDTARSNETVPTIDTASSSDTALTSDTAHSNETVLTIDTASRGETTSSSDTAVTSDTAPSTDMALTSDTTHSSSQLTPSRSETTSSSDTVLTSGSTPSSDKTLTSDKPKMAVYKSALRVNYVRQNNPGITHNNPGTTQNNPGITHNNPGTTQNNPGTTQNNQGTTQNKPGTAQNNPGTIQNNPGTTQNNPGTTQNNPGTTQNNLGPYEYEQGAHSAPSGKFRPTTEQRTRETRDLFTTGNVSETVGFKYGVTTGDKQSVEEQHVNVKEQNNDMFKEQNIDRFVKVKQQNDDIGRIPPWVTPQQDLRDDKQQPYKIELEQKQESRAQKQLLTISQLDRGSEEENERLGVVQDLTNENPEAGNRDENGHPTAQEGISYADRYLLNQKLKPSIVSQQTRIHNPFVHTPGQLTHNSHPQSQVNTHNSHPQSQVNTHNIHPQSQAYTYNNRQRSQADTHKSYPQSQMNKGNNQHARTVHTQSEDMLRSSPRNNPNQPDHQGLNEPKLTRDPKTDQQDLSGNLLTPSSQRQTSYIDRFLALDKPYGVIPNQPVQVHYQPYVIYYTYPSYPYGYVSGDPSSTDAYNPSSERYQEKTGDEEEVERVGEEVERVGEEVERVGQEDNESDEDDENNDEQSQTLYDKQYTNTGYDGGYSGTKQGYDGGYSGTKQGYDGGYTSTNQGYNGGYTSANQGYNGGYTSTKQGYNGYIDKNKGYNDGYSGTKQGYNGGYSGTNQRYNDGYSGTKQGYNDGYSGTKQGYNGGYSGTKQGHNGGYSGTKQGYNGGYIGANQGYNGGYTSTKQGYNGGYTSTKQGYNDGYSGRILGYPSTKQSFKEYPGTKDLSSDGYPGTRQTYRDRYLSSKKTYADGNYVRGYYGNTGIRGNMSPNDARNGITQGSNTWSNKNIRWKQLGLSNSNNNNLLGRDAYSDGWVNREKNINGQNENYPRGYWNRASYYKDGKLSHKGGTWTQNNQYKTKYPTQGQYKPRFVRGTRKQNGNFGQFDFKDYSGGSRYQQGDVKDYSGGSRYQQGDLKDYSGGNRYQQGDVKDYSGGSRYQQGDLKISKENDMDEDAVLHFIFSQKKFSSKNPGMAPNNGFPVPMFDSKNSEMKGGHDDREGEEAVEQFLYTKPKYGKKGNNPLAGILKI